jgi:hypothetical protein
MGAMASQPDGAARAAGVLPFVRQRERRRSLRLVVVDWLYDVRGQALTLDVPITLHDISVGGCALESSREMRAGETHLFRFTAQSGMSFLVTAVAVHSMPTETPGRFLTGLRFVKTPGAPDPVEELIASIAAVLS